VLRFVITSRSAYLSPVFRIALCAPSLSREGFHGKRCKNRCIWTLLVTGTAFVSFLQCDDVVHEEHNILICYLANGDACEGRRLPYNVLRHFRARTHIGLASSPGVGRLRNCVPRALRRAESQLVPVGTRDVFIHLVSNICSVRILSE